MRRQIGLAALAAWEAENGAFTPEELAAARAEMAAADHEYFQGGESDRRMWARHKLALQDGRDVRVPAIVVGQAWRDGACQVQLARALAGCQADPVGLDTSKAAGVLCSRAGLTALARHSGTRPVPVIRAV